MKTNPEQFLKNLEDFLLDSENMTKDEIEAELREEGIDPDKLISQCRKIVNSWYDRWVGNND